MKKYLIILISVFSTHLSFAQVTLCLGQDATVCQGQTVQITNCNSSSGGGTGGLYLNAPSTVSLGDDDWSAAVPLGFSFNFYGTNYTQCIIGSNGIISFNISDAGGYCAWSLDGTPLPNPSVSQTLNSVMMCYQDLLPQITTPIQYQTLGTAPNRRFVVLYNGLSLFGSCTGECTYAGAILYESSNVIEAFIGQKGNCASWNNNLAIQGTHNLPGSSAHITPGRNNTVWAANQDGRRWTPTSPTVTTAYTITTIPYVNINASGGGIAWSSTLGQTLPYNGGVLDINQVPPGTTGYYLSGSSCGVSLGSVSDTTYITRTSVSATVTTTTDYCSGGSGSASASPGVGTQPFQYLWTPSGQTTATVTNLAAGSYTLLVTDASGCSKNIPVNVPNFTPIFGGTKTPVSCPGGSDGTVTATMTPPMGTITYLWDDPAAQTTQTATGLPVGTYHCTVTSSTGCTGTATLTVTGIPGMTAPITQQTDPTCNSGSDGVLVFGVTGGTPGYTYNWDNSSSVSNSATDLSVGAHTITITDANGCVITEFATLGEPAPLQITALTPDQIICPEATTVLSVQGQGGSSPYVFTWTENGTPVGTGSSITVDPVNSGTTYCVTMAEVCGSPTTNSCMVITFPTKIIPAFVPDKISDCQPGTFLFTNTSNNQGEIASVLLEFGDGQSVTLPGANDVSHTYVDAQPYNLRATITSIQGCVTETVFPALVNVLPKPKADFNFSSNPTTMFETMVVMQNKSSAAVTSWEWASPSSVPPVSTSENPTFHFPDGVVSTYPVELIVTTDDGCKDTVEYILNVINDILFYAPNTFTPDGDEFNQTWDFSVIGIDEHNFELMIFDRWGETVWETHDVNALWDGTYHGKVVPAGTYSWIAKVKSLWDDGKKDFNGSIVIIR